MSLCLVPSQSRKGQSGYALRMPDPRDEGEEHPILEAFNAEGVVEDPGDPEANEPSSPAADADAPAPPG